MKDKGLRVWIYVELLQKCEQMKLKENVQRSGQLVHKRRTKNTWDKWETINKNFEKMVNLIRNLRNANW